jgi:tight adherence protein B
MAIAPEWLLAAGSLVLALAVALLAWRIQPLWDRVTERTIADLSPAMRDLNLDVSVLPGYLRLWTLALLLTGLLFLLVLRMPLLAVPALILVYRSPRFLLRGRIRKQRIQLRDQLVTACVALANTARAGMALAQGLESIAPETAEPLATELRRINADFQRGRPLADALRATRDRLDLDSFTLFATAILVCLERGGRITEALDRISRSLQENQRLERKLDADTASGRKVLVMLALAPLGFMMLFGMVDPDSTQLLFSTAAGQVILIIVIVLVYLSVRWARSILKLNAAG